MVQRLVMADLPIKPAWRTEAKRNSGDRRANRARAMAGAVAT